MAGGQERILRRRIRSIQSTRKTTRAMELIAGSRIMRAQQRIAGARPYVDHLNRIAADVTSAPGGPGPRLIATESEVSSVAVIAIAADRGLCGAYNSTVLRTAEEGLARHRTAGRRTMLVTVGKRAESYLRFRGHRADHSIIDVTDRPAYEDARRVAATVVEPYESGEVDLVELVSTRFVSAGTQHVETETVVPLSREAERETVDYELEPDRDDLLEVLGPQLIEARIFMAMLEASAAEHAARQRAMKAATDNADDLIVNLRRIMNRVRQDTITTEIMDIVGGAEALRASHVPGGDGSAA